MQSRLKGLEFERIQAVSGKELNLKEQIITNGLTSPELACISSHIKALKRFLKSKSELCCILEDDVILGENFFRILEINYEFPDDAYIIELETFEHKIWISKSSAKINDLKLERLHSIHYGSAAYLTSRKGAKFLIQELEKYDAPVDHIFFDKMLDNKKFGHALQLSPACCIQENFNDQSIDSDIYSDRRASWMNSKSKINRNANYIKDKIIREFKRILNQLIGMGNIFMAIFGSKILPKRYIKIKFKS